MQLSTAMNHRDRLSRLVCDIYSSGRWGASTHEQILEQLRERIYGDPAWGRVPGWVQSSITQLGSRESSELYKPQIHGADLERMLQTARDGGEVKTPPYVVWRLTVDGEFVTSDLICARRKAGDDDIWQRVTGGFVWSHRPDRPFRKPESQSHTGVIREASAT